MSVTDVPELPLEILSNVSSLFLPPFYPPPLPAQPHPHPPTHIVEALDPVPPPYQTSSQIISTISKSSSKLLEASRPWLWQNVDVRSGRGWLAIVNALTEEVIQLEEVEVDRGRDNDLSAQTTSSTIVRRIPNPRGVGEAVISTTTVNSTPEVQPQAGPSTQQITSEPTPVSAFEAHQQPNSISSGYALYTSNSTQHNIPYAAPLPSSSTIPALPLHQQGQYNYSPPQPNSIVQLLTPPGSRGTSPSPLPPPVIKSPTIIQTAKLRGRSRSPRRQINFEDGISAVLDRSRSLSTTRTPGDHKRLSLSPSPGPGPSSGPWPRRISLERRRSSLSRVRTMHDIPDDEDDKDDGDDDIEMPDSAGSSAFMSRHPLSPPIPVPEETYCNVNPELLPPPGPYIRHLSFTNFRTIGSRRTQDEAVRGRFVTAGRLEGVLKNAPNLVTLCMTEYVDSSLSTPVVEELLFRGYRRPRKPRRSSMSNNLSRVRSLSLGPAPSVTISDVNQLDPPRPVYVPYEEETEDDMWKRRGLFTALEALDLTGCVSRHFTEAMVDFYDSWLSDQGVSDQDQERGRGRSRRRQDSTDEESDHEPVFLSPRPQIRRRPRLSAMRRLSLRACTSLDSLLLHEFLLCFPALTHLDLSGTRVPSSFLMALTEQPPSTLRIQSLSLARCPKLDTHVVVEFIAKSPAARDLVELNLYVSPTQGNAFNSNELTRLLQAPCFKSGKLRYLDLSSARFTVNHLTPEYFPSQPSLISLGLSYIPSLPLRPISEFLQNQAPNVEILTLTGTAIENTLRPSASPLQINLEIHANLINPITTVPFSLSSLSLKPTETYGVPGSAGINLSPGPTRLRVVELSSNVRRAILDGGGGGGEWQVIRSKGARGWYVDTSAGWIPIPHDRLDNDQSTSMNSTRPKFKSNSSRQRSETESSQTSSNFESGSEMEIEGDDEEEAGPPPPVTWQFLRHIPRSHPWRKYLSSLSDANGRVSSNVGWHSRKMEVVRGLGMLSREEGMAGAGGFAFEE